MAGPTEHAIELAICASLVGPGGYDAVKVGTAEPHDLDAALAIDTAEQVQAGANDFERFVVGLDAQWQSKLLQRHQTDEDLVDAMLDNPELKAAWVARSAPMIYARARVAWQRTCPIGALLRSDGDLRYLEVLPELSDRVVQVVAGFANSASGGTLLVDLSVTDRGAWTGQLAALLGRLGASAAALGGDDRSHRRPAGARPHHRSTMAVRPWASLRRLRTPIAGSSGRCHTPWVDSGPSPIIPCSRRSRRPCASGSRRRSPSPHRRRCRDGRTSRPGSTR